MADQFLDNLSAVVAQRIAADPFFVDITVKEERKGNVTADVNAALARQGLLKKAGKVGACVVVRAAMPERAEGEATAMLQVSLEIEVCENPLINGGDSGTGKTAAQIWTVLYRLLNGYHDQNLNQILTAEERPAVTQSTDDALLYVLRMRCFYPIEYKAKCSIASDGAGGTLKVEQVSGTTFRARATTSTSGALIHYAVSLLSVAPVLPTSSSPSASSGAWYEFTVNEDSRIIAVAYATDKIASDSLYNEIAG